MNRHEALNFIRDNSPSVRSFLLTTKKEWEENRNEPYEPTYFEQRIGNNGNLFCLLDMGKQHGWELYFISGGNRIDKSLSEFAEATGCELPAAELNQK